MTHRFNRSQIMREANAIAAKARANTFYADWSHSAIMAMAMRAAWLNAKREAWYNRPREVMTPEQQRRAAINDIYNKDRWSDADKAELDGLRYAA
jgi:hypothetical protein